jgi:hypothetical protein
VLTDRAFIKTCGMNLQVLLLREKPQESPVAATIVEPLQRLRSHISFKLSHNLDEIVELEESGCMEWISEFFLVINNGIRASTLKVISRVEACGVDHGQHKLKGAIDTLKQLKSHFRKRRSLLADTPSTVATTNAT